ncbi:MAG: hypothetical protein R6V05_08915 [Candidatus Brocadiia bacterium]
MLAVAALALLAGCAGPRDEAPGPVAPPAGPEARVQTGMSAEDVRAELGEPALCQTAGQADEIQMWYYESGVVVILEGGRVRFRGRAAAPAPGEGSEGGTP